MPRKKRKCGTEGAPQKVLEKKNESRSESRNESPLSDYDSDNTIIDSDYTPNDWRNGPAKRWYDMMGLSPNCTEYDYGFKLKEKSCRSPPNTGIDSEDAFNLVSQISWEKNVIWDSDSVRQKVMKTAEKPSIAGWIPVDDKRTAPEFFKEIDDNTIDKLIANELIPRELISRSKENNINICDKTKEKTILNTFSNKLRTKKTQFCDKDNDMPNNSSADDVKDMFTDVKAIIKWVSTLPEENRELTYNRWEDDIIWDPKAMTRIPEPKIIPFSCDDDNAIVEWNDFDDNSNDSNHNSLAKTLRLSLNISNDEFYASVVKADNKAVHQIVISHSIPANDLHPLCFPTWDPDFFRPILKKTRKLRARVEHEVLLCDQNNCLPSEEQKTTDLSKYRILNFGQLSARSGQIILTEYSEESPPLMMRVGMGSQLSNYFVKSKDKNYCPEDHRFAQTRTVSENTFIGELGTNKSQLALETNMFRSPIWEQTCPDTDFLVIRTENNYYIREIDGLFVVGQTLPLIEVPRFKTPSYYKFAKQFAKMFIYRLFDNRKSVNDLDTELKNAFPNLNRNQLISLRQQLTLKNNDRFVLKSEIPFDNQIHDLLTPENCCAYYSTAITAATTLKEMGVGDRLFLDDNENDSKVDELPFAPWNTTSAYISSVNSKKLLNVNDYNEDGSLVFSTQSYKEFKDQMPAMRKCVPLSDISIKRLNLKRAHQWLIDYGMARNKVRRYKSVVECRELIKHLSDSLRESGMTSKMNKTKTTEQYYKLQCKKIFDLQTFVYGSKQCYESDESNGEEEEEEDNSDPELDEFAEILEDMIMKNKSQEEIVFEREERERKEWIQTIKGKKDPKQKDEVIKNWRSFNGKVLKISRTYEMDGKKFVRDEIVRNPRVIQAYTRIRETKNDAFIRELSMVKNIKEKGLNKTKANKSNSVPKPQETPKNVNGVLKTVSENISNIRNGFVGNGLKDIDEIDINDDNWDINESAVEENESKLVRVDGSKLKFSKKVVLEANQIEAEEQKRIQQELEEEERSKRVEYFTNRSTKRMRIDPMVILKDIFDSVIVQVRKVPELDDSIEWFNEPIKVKDVPDYYQIIENPMDLRTMRDNVSRGKYSSRQEFLKDIELIYENCLEYNGDCQITSDAFKLYQICRDKLDSKAEQIKPLEEMYRSQVLNS